MKSLKLILFSVLLASVIAVPGYAMSTNYGQSGYSYSQLNGAYQPVHDWDHHHGWHRRHYWGPHGGPYYRGYYYGPNPYYGGYYYDPYYYRPFRPGFEFHIGF